jgi:hypothetical protein
MPRKLSRRLQRKSLRTFLSGVVSQGRAEGGFLPQVRSFHVHILLGGEREHVCGIAPDMV